MKKMLPQSLSFAALFSLATACAVDPDETPSREDEITCIACDNGALELDESSTTAKPPGARPLAELDDHLEGIDAVEYCEQNYDCESNICDQETNSCRDYPF